jgi:hypothetical protein
MRAVNIASIGCFLAIVLGCAGAGALSQDEVRHPTNQPAVADLVGHYQPTAATKELITSQGHYPARDISIVLERNGTLRFQNIPDWWQEGHGKSGGKFDSWTGTWEVAKHDHGWWELSVLLSNPGGVATHVDLIGQHAPYRLALVVGDPDAGREMQFERVEPPPAAKP